MSTAAHLVIFTMLGLVPPPSEVLAMEDIEIEVVEPELPKDEPPPPPPPPPEPEPEPKQQARRAEPEAEPPPPEPAAPPPEEVADFTGVTLTAEGDGAGWSTAVGSGAPLKGPVGKINRGPTEPQQAAKAVPVGPRFVPAGSLARKPRPPSGLAALLEQHYPRRARMQGVGGRAKVMLRILPSGRATDMRVMEESPDGFGFAIACMEMLRQAGSFSPAIDRSGVAVATEVPFNCDFVVDD
jgi:TonB family protein